MLEDSLKDKLAHRPQPAEVIEKGILNGEMGLITNSEDVMLTIVCIEFQPMRIQLSK